MLPMPQAGESETTFMDRCLADATVNAEHPDADQRYAVCAAQWRGGAAGRAAADGGDGAGDGAGDKGADNPGGGGERGGGGPGAYKVGGRPKREFRLVPLGRVQTDGAVRGGDFLFTPEHARQAVAWFAALGRKLAIDYEHQSVEGLNRRADGLMPAAGWIGRLELRADGLWACDVEWTATAASLLERGEYAYMSPVIYWADPQQRRLAALGPVALTNDPAMKHVEPLVASRRARGPAHQHATSFALSVSASQLTRPVSPGHAKGGPGMDRIRKLLGLPDGATEEQIVTRLTALQEAERQTVLKLGQELGVPAPDAAGLVSALKARLQPAPDADAGVVTALRRQVEEQAAAIELLRTANARAEFNATLHGAEHSGKIPPADEEQYFALFRTDRKLFDTVLRNTPRKVAAASVFTGTRRAAATAQGEAGWKTEFDASPELADEFGTVETYVAFKRAEAAGQVNILKR